MSDSDEEDGESSSAQDRSKVIPSDGSDLIESDDDVCGTSGSEVDNLVDSDDHNALKFVQ